MKSLLLHAVVLTAALPGIATELTIVRVITGWRDAASFKRISEYFDGKENPSGTTLLRTQPDRREGYYFLVRTKNPGAPKPIKASLAVITSSTAKPVTHSFPAELKTGDTVIHLGLTGSDWPDPLASPVAWKLDLIGGDGLVLATEKSYLWEIPVGN